MKKATILFDGVCNLCNGFVNFVIDRDHQARFQFGSLQSAAGQALLKSYTFESAALTTVILIEDDKLYSESTAVLKILRGLGGGWKVFYILMVIPKFIRDFFYNLVSRHRYYLFGKREYCRIPTPDLLNRFIE